MDPLSTAETELSKAGFETWLHTDETERMYFEDRSVFGMVSAYPSVSNLLKKWESRQDEFLEAYQDSLRSPEGEQKVWNAYTVHLTIGDFSEAKKNRTRQENRLFKIENNFRGTRKIARANISNDEDVKDALLPLLPLQRKPELAAENYREQLVQELDEDFDYAFLNLLDEEASVNDIVTELLNTQ